MMFETRKLKTLVAIADERSFTGAAERLNTSQPWVSEQVKQIEETLDIPLFERMKGKFVKPTIRGEEFIAIARRVVASCEAAGAEMEALRDRDRNRLVLGVDPVTLYIPERNQLMADFMARFPNLELEVVNETPHELFAGLRSGRYDLLLTLCPHPDDDIEVLPLYEYDLKLFAPTAVLRQPHFSDPRGVGDVEVLILPDRYHPNFFAWLKSAFAPAGFTWTACPEISFHALLRYAVMMGRPTVTPDFSDRMPELYQGMEELPVRMPHAVSARWGLMRVNGYRRRFAERFWKMAQARAKQAHEDVI